jgi:galactokinase
MSDKELLEKLLLSRAAYYEKPNDNIDFFVMLKAKPDTFQVINEDKREIRFIKNPFDGYKLFIFDSRIPRLESSGELIRRDKQLLNGLDVLRQKKPTITFNDPRCRDLIETNESMNEETRRRCLHIVNELERLKLMESAIVANDYASSAKLFQHSQEDLRDLYEVSCPEVDWLVKRASETRGVVGSRMTGLGFAPCTFIIATDEGAAEFRAKLDDYERIFGFHPIDYEVAIAGPATVVK